MAIKFKVGDRVRVITKSFGDDQYGDVGVVASVRKDKLLPKLLVESLIRRIKDEMKEPLMKEAERIIDEAIAAVAKDLEVRAFQSADPYHGHNTVKFIIERR